MLKYTQKTWVSRTAPFLIITWPQMVFGLLSNQTWLISSNCTRNNKQFCHYQLSFLLCWKLWKVNSYLRANHIYIPYCYTINIGWKFSLAKTYNTKIHVVNRIYQRNVHVYTYNTHTKTPNLYCTTESGRKHWKPFTYCHSKLTLISCSPTQRGKVVKMTRWRNPPDLTVHSKVFITRYTTLYAKRQYIGAGELTH